MWTIETFNAFYPQTFAQKYFIPLMGLFPLLLSIATFVYDYYSGFATDGYFSCVPFLPFYCMSGIMDLAGLSRNEKMSFGFFQAQKTIVNKQTEENRLSNSTFHWSDIELTIIYHAKAFAVGVIEKVSNLLFTLSDNSSTPLPAYEVSPAVSHPFTDAFKLPPCPTPTWINDTHYLVPKSLNCSWAPDQVWPLTNFSVLYLYTSSKVFLNSPSFICSDLSKVAFIV